ncbi:unnamed protein product [Gadus morhua 'NCC']
MCVCVCVCVVCVCGYGYVLALLSMMDGDLCRPVNTQSKTQCPDLRYSRREVTRSPPRRFNHHEHQLRPLGRLV